MKLAGPWHPDSASAAPLLAGVELGGTKIVCTLGSGPDLVMASERIATGEPDATLSAVERVLDGWLEAYPSIAGIGLASFGPLELDPASPACGSIINTAKPGWSGVEIGSRIARRYGLPLGFDTDVNGAALAEGRWGAARGLGSWIYITIGTGVGAGIIVGGATMKGLGHSEAGHMLVRRPPGDTWPGVCPFHADCVEGLVSGPAIAARFGIEGRAVAADDAGWQPICTTIAGMIHNLVMVAAPQIVILGGGVMSSRPELFAPIRRQLVESLGNYAHAVAVADRIDRFVLPPALGDMAGPLGALALASDAVTLANGDGVRLANLAPTPRASSRAEDERRADA